ncbi:MAG TPA: hypothetical protein VF571_07390 [Pyrinomonadaceae bacterium]|jgi:hypothetical protein
MITTKKIENSVHADKDFERANYELLVDGEYLPKVSVTGYKTNEKELEFEFYTNDIYSGGKLLSQEIKDFPRFEYVNVPVNINCNEFETYIYFYPTSSPSKKHTITFYFDAKLLFWKESYSFTDFEQSILEFKKEKVYKNGKIEIYNSNDETKFTIEKVIKIGDSSLFEEFSPFFEECRSLYLHFRQRTLEKTNKVTFTNSFNFPEELKVSCEQYLLYFAQFLRDLGINATSNLKEEAGKVLFSVTPTDDVDALDKIREALAVYLNLPSSPIIYNESFEAMRLQQQIENLQYSQRMKEREIRTSSNELRLAQTVIEHQDKIILQKDSIIEQQNKVIEKITSKSIMMDSLENKEELEKFCEGFEVGKSEFLIKHFGLHLNPATVLKTMGKKILGKEDENKSVLGLDDEEN